MPISKLLKKICNCLFSEKTMNKIDSLRTCRNAANRLLKSRKLCSVWGTGVDSLHLSSLVWCWGMFANGPWAPAGISAKTKKPEMKEEEEEEEESDEMWDAVLPVYRCCCKQMFISCQLSVICFRDEKSLHVLLAFRQPDSLFWDLLSRLIKQMHVWRVWNLQNVWKMNRSLPQSFDHFER